MLDDIKAFFIAWPIVMIGWAIFGDFQLFTPISTAIGVVACILLYRLVNGDTD